MALKEPKNSNTEEGKASKNSINNNSKKIANKAKANNKIKIQTMQKKYRKRVPPPTERKTRGQLAQEASNPLPPEENKDQEDSYATIEEAADYDSRPVLEDSPEEPHTQNENMEAEKNKEEAEEEEEGAKKMQEEVDDEVGEDDSEEYEDRSSNMGEDEDEENYNKEEEAEEDMWKDFTDKELHEYMKDKKNNMDIESTEATTWKKKPFKRDTKKKKKELKTKDKVIPTEPQGTSEKRS
jgi:hypothetical protein